MSSRLSRDEAWQVLNESHTGIFTTLRRDGRPVSLPVWFVALDDHIYVASPAGRSKVQRVRHDSRVAFVVESGERWEELVGVHIAGEARVIDDPDRVLAVQAAIDDKYDSYRSRPSASPSSGGSGYGPEIAVIEITPDDRILSWDNSRPRVRR